MTVSDLVKIAITEVKENGGKIIVDNNITIASIGTGEVTINL